MNGSLLTADRATHRRIVLTAAAAAVLFGMIGLCARISSANGPAAVSASGRVLSVTPLDLTPARNVTKGFVDRIPA